MRAHTLALLLTSSFAIRTSGTPIEDITLDRRGSKIIIGYRAVHPGQAAVYEKAKNTLTYDGPVGGIQLGKGVYTSPELGGWPAPENYSHCAILADVDEFQKVPKAWVPKGYWWPSKKNPNIVDDYIKGLGQSWDPDKTIRMSVIDGSDDEQMLIPPGLLNSKGGKLEIETVCNKDQSKLPSASIDYNSWGNVKGVRGRGKKSLKHSGKGSPNDLSNSIAEE